MSVLLVICTSNADLN